MDGGLQEGARYNRAGDCERDDLLVHGAESLNEKAARCHFSNEYWFAYSRDPSQKYLALTCQILRNTKASSYSPVTRFLRLRVGSRVVVFPTLVIQPGSSRASTTILGDLRHLREKLNSDFFKTKVRIRWYADAESGKPQGMAYLEIKRKVGRSRQKVRAETDLSAQYVADLDLHAQEHCQIRRRLGELGFPGASLAPFFQITFRRRRFVDPFTGARLAIDQGIRVPRVNHQLAPRANPTPLSKAVFEVKGLPDQIPHFIPLLISFGGRKESFSKYFRCYQHLMQTTF